MATDLVFMIRAANSLWARVCHSIIASLQVDPRIMSDAAIMTEMQGAGFIDPPATGWISASSLMLFFASLGFLH